MQFPAFASSGRFPGGPASAPAKKYKKGSLLKKFVDSALSFIKKILFSETSGGDASGIERSRKILFHGRRANS
jgi:hypothetical protein